MIILSDCLTEKMDEGCLKVANSLTQRMKARYPETTVVSYKRKPVQSDIHLQLNKLFLNGSLVSLIRKKQEPVLYIPFASNTLASILRACILSLFGRQKIYVLFALRHPMNHLAMALLKYSHANVVVLSRKSYDYYKRIIGDKIIYLRTGVDLQRFSRVDGETRERLRDKYAVDKNADVVLHVGHLHGGRNVQALCDIPEDKQVILVVSSVSEQDEELKRRLESRKNIRIIEEYLPDIQEMYQLADVYLFPVSKEENSIDVPLSVLEAAGCGLPVVTTRYGELCEFINKQGFYFMDTVIRECMNQQIDKALMERLEPHDLVLAYDWENSLHYLNDRIGG